MGLISTEVEVGLGNKNIKYYENLGYEIPRYYDKNNRKESVKRGSKIKVNVQDLSHGSQVKVTVQCDYCGKIYDIVYKDYCVSNHNGKTFCNYCANKALLSGENHYKWKSEKTNDERILGRDYPEYKEFIKRVLIRDNYTCQCCGATNYKLNVHHLDSYDWCVEGRTNDSNAIALCENCHENFHYQYGKGENTRRQFEEWLGHTIPLLEKYNGVLPTTRQIYDIEENKVYNGAYEYAKLHTVCPTLVYNCCNHRILRRKYINKKNEISYTEYTPNTVHGHHLLYLSEYEKMTPKEVERCLQQRVNKTYTMVICITTGKIFESIAEAARYYKVNECGISDCCRDRAKTAGKLNSVPLKWMYLSDFKKLPQEEQEKILANVKEELS